MQDVRPLFAPDRYSAKKMVKPVSFVCTAPGARQVSLIGDFNGWDPTTHSMKRQPDGSWLLQVPLHHGHHHYLFLIDGTPSLDPRGQGIARKEQGERVSLKYVS